MSATKYSTIKRKPRVSTIIIIVLLHILAIYGLTRAFAPQAVESVERSIISAFTVTITAPEEAPPPEAEPIPDEGAAGDAGKKAKPKPVAAPETPLKPNWPMPKASSTGTANASGAKEAGDGTGAAGTGDGTGSGRGGGGQGGVTIATKPSVRSGELNTASDFPVPEGGRETRFGKSVTVHFTVGIDGVAKNCSVARSGVDSATTALVCPLVVRKIRFNPAKRSDGTLAEARYGYRVDFNSSR
ncbi:energy transducer TonB [Pontixanthobacter aquaemixtae]|uniref:TonB C-terminal domain-containing protein n=1 Tax=Pontixanthobacter aquaemixtae TaxID=1958940 RepID=A0A844ZP11_9SPHN|nr:hypothetical protein [Pontixanthobacter aquaemixtae]MXO89294.1 hypothetical protein [Pontixanthobacter aquaemixtae]